jgi:hypothetical protein
VARLARSAFVRWDYQVPEPGQAPEFVLVQVRVGAPPPVLMMEKLLPDLECPTTV